MRICQHTKPCVTFFQVLKLEMYFSVNSISEDCLKHYAQMNGWAVILKELIFMLSCLTLTLSCFLTRQCPCHRCPRYLSPNSVRRMSGHSNLYIVAHNNTYALHTGESLLIPERYPQPKFYVRGEVWSFWFVHHGSSSYPCISHSGITGYPNFYFMGDF